jgi:Domain of unknown function (DUF4891)
MKALLVLFFFLLLLLSCQQTNRSQATEDDAKEAVDSLPKATAIFWVDKKKSNLTQKKDSPLPVRTAKAKVDIDSTGKINVLSYAKPQEQKVINYLHYRLNIFRVTKVMLDSGFVKPGIQYVQLRYMPERMEKHRG